MTIDTPLANECRARLKMAYVASRADATSRASIIDIYDAYVCRLSYVSLRARIPLRLVKFRRHVGGEPRERTARFRLGENFGSHVTPAPSTTFQCARRWFLVELSTIDSPEAFSMGEFSSRDSRIRANEKFPEWRRSAYLDLAAFDIDLVAT